MRAISVLAIGIVALCALGVVAVTIASTPPSIARVSGYSLPTEIDGRFTLAPLPMQPGIDSDKALSLAEGYAGGLASTPTGVSVQAVLFTDHDRGTDNPDGSITPIFVNVPAYIVRFTGVPQPIFARLGAQPGHPAQELNVVLNANTGNYVEMFSFQ